MTGAAVILRGRNDGRFDPPIPVSLGLGPTDYWTLLEASDLNGDGDTDLVGVSARDGLRVLQGMGDGSFASPTTVIYPEGRFISALAVGDLDVDGDADIAVTSTDSIDVLLGNGDGTFGTKCSFKGSRPARSLAVADFDLDHRPDLAFAAGPMVAVALGNGDGTFRQPSLLGTGRSVLALAAGDLDGDRRADLVTVDSGFDGAVVLVNRLEPVPVAVLDLEAVETRAGVRLEWGLARDGLAMTVGVRVERAGAAEGPYVEITPAPLVPAARMSFTDALGPRQAWYRLVLEMQDGGRILAGPIAVSPRPSPLVTALHPLIVAAGGVWIHYDLASAARVRLGIFDVRGHAVATLANGAVPAGKHATVWRPEALPRGVYFVHLNTGSMRAARKLVWLTGSTGIAP